MREIVDGAVKNFEASEDARLLNDSFHSAFRMMTSEQARAAFDITKEKPAVRERYGMNRFGQCCLLARRSSKTASAWSRSTASSPSSINSRGTSTARSRSSPSSK